MSSYKKVSFHYAINYYRIVQGIPLEICYSKSGGEKFLETEIFRYGKNVFGR